MGDLNEWQAFSRRLTKSQRERLKRHECFLCEVRLDQGVCFAIGAPRCSPEEMVKRAANCLNASPRAHIRAAQEEPEA